MRSFSWTDISVEGGERTVRQQRPGKRTWHLVGCIGDGIVPLRRARRQGKRALMRAWLSQAVIEQRQEGDEEKREKPPFAGKALQARASCLG